MSFLENQRRFLNDVIPTLFKHNADKEPQKRQSSMAREEERAKPQFCADACSHNKRMQDFQFICNTKRTQTETSTFSSIYTQTECQLQSDFAAPCNIKDLLNDHSPVSVEQESDQSECESQNEYDSDFKMQEKSCNESDNEDSNFEPKAPKVTFIVFWSSLLMLLCRCLHPTCFLPAKIKNFSLNSTV